MVHHDQCTFVFHVNWFIITVRPLLYTEFDYPRFLRPKLSTPKLYEIQSDLYYSHLYLSIICGPRLSPVFKTKI